jgi:hypothetical protein
MLAAAAIAHVMAIAGPPTDFVAQEMRAERMKNKARKRVSFVNGVRNVSG